MTLKYKCTFGLAEGKKYECDAKAKSRFAWTVQRYCSSIYRHRSQPVTNYNYAPCGSLQHWLGHTCIKRSFCLYVGLKRRSSMKRDLRPSLGDDFSRSCFFVWDLRRTEARPQHAAMLNGIIRHADCTLIITYIQEYWPSMTFWWYYKRHRRCVIKGLLWRNIKKYDVPKEEYS